MLKDKRQILAFSLLLFSSTQIFAATCDELLQHCNGILKYYADIIAQQVAQGIPPERQWTMPDIQCVLTVPPGEPEGSRERYIEDDPIGWCSQRPRFECAFPKVKVGEYPNGDAKCACPSGMQTQVASTIEQTILEQQYQDDHIHAQCGPPESGDSYSANNGCKEGYKQNPIYAGENLTNPTINNLNYCVADYQSMQCGAGEWKVTNPATGNASGYSNKRMNSQLSTCAVHNTLVSSGSASGSCSDYMGSQGLTAQGLKGRCQPDSNGGAECCVSNDPDAVARNHSTKGEGIGDKCAQGQSFYQNRYKNQATGQLEPQLITQASKQDMIDMGLDNFYRCQCEGRIMNKRDPPQAVVIYTSSFRDYVGECDYK